MSAAAAEIRVGCSGWYYWHWRGVVYPETLSTRQWFDHYQSVFDTVELNAPFYHWPRPNTVRQWARAARAGFRYSLKVNQAITHLKRFRGTRRLVRRFYQLGELLGEHLGCFLFQLPPSFHYTEARLRAVLDQLDPQQANVVEFRHPGWWNEAVFEAFRKAGAIFCSVSAPRLPDALVCTGPALYVRFHGASRWYAHDYSADELRAWADKIRAAGVRQVWAYFNNDREGCAFRNARALRELLSGRPERAVPRKARRSRKTDAGALDD